VHESIKVSTITKYLSQTEKTYANLKYCGLQDFQRGDKWGNTVLGAGLEERINKLFSHLKTRFKADI